MALNCTGIISLCCRNVSKNGVILRALHPMSVRAPVISLSLGFDFRQELNNHRRFLHKISYLIPYVRTISAHKMAFFPSFYLFFFPLKSFLRLSKFRVFALPRNISMNIHKRI